MGLLTFVLDLLANAGRGRRASLYVIIAIT